MFTPTSRYWNCVFTNGLIPTPPMPGLKSPRRDGNARADLEGRLLTVRRSNFRILQQFRIGIAQQSVQLSLRDTHCEVGGIQVCEGVQSKSVVGGSGWLSVGVAGVWIRGSSLPRRNKLNSDRSIRQRRREPQVTHLLT